MTAYSLITPATWELLIKANEGVAAPSGWAERGVFATGVGPDYAPNREDSLLYVGKSAGPLATLVGYSHDQASSAQASVRWMIERRNKRSHFWQFIEQIDPTRRRIAWTNVCKMDRIGGKRPPSESEFAQVAPECMAALEDELASLKPRVTVFATSGWYDAHVQRLLERLGYEPCGFPFEDGQTSCARSSENHFIIRMKHPQGWAIDGRQKVVELLRSLLSSGETSVQ